MGILAKLLGYIHYFIDRRAAALCLPVLAATSLTACISSNAPILTDAKPVLGQQGQIHSYELADRGAGNPEVVSFRWNGSRYLFRGRSEDIRDFTVYPYEGRDLIVQSTAARPPHRAEYALARRLAAGVYLIVAIDEADADEATRERFCTKTQNAPCSITTPEQLFAFARATAAKIPERGSLAVIVPSGAR